MFSLMKQKSEFTTLERAIQTVDGFSHVFTTLRQQTALRGQSESTLYNYMHRIALVSLHFKRLPEGISDEEFTEYLTALHLMLILLLGAVLNTPFMACGIIIVMLGFPGSDH